MAELSQKLFDVSSREIASFAVVFARRPFGCRPAAMAGVQARRLAAGLVFVIVAGSAVAAPIDYLLPEFWRVTGAVETLNPPDGYLIGALARPRIFSRRSRDAGIARGRNLGVIDMRQIAHNLAQLMGVRLPSSEASPLHVAR